MAQSSQESIMENQDQNNGANGNGGNGNGQQEDERTLGDYASPNVAGCTSSIVKPPFQANNFEIRLALLNLVQQDQFGERPVDDPNAYITNFINV